MENVSKPAAVKKTQAKRTTAKKAPAMKTAANDNDTVPTMKANGEVQTRPKPTQSLIVALKDSVTVIKYLPVITQATESSPHCFPSLTRHLPWH